VICKEHRWDLAGIQRAVHLVPPRCALRWSTPPSPRVRSGGCCSTFWGEDYIRTARAKGLRRRTAMYNCGVRAALTPVVAQRGIVVGTLLTTSFIVVMHRAVDLVHAVLDPRVRFS